MSTVIGVHDGHNASVAVVREGRVEFALQEERITLRRSQGQQERDVRRLDRSIRAADTEFHDAFVAAQRAAEERARSAKR